MAIQISFSKKLFKFIYKLHVYAGLYVAVHMAIFSISGLALLFKDEIQKSPVSVEKLNVTQDEQAQAYEVVYQQIKSKYPTDRLLAFFPDEEHTNILNVRSGHEGETKLRGARRTLFNLNSGEEILKKPSASAGFFEWMLILHRELFLGSNGKIYIGFVGLVYVFMLLSGFFIYGRFMKNRLLGEIRQARLPKLIDLHKFVGVVTFGWGLVVGLSGSFLAFNGVLIKFFQYKSLQHLSNQYQNFQSASASLASFKDVVATALQSRSDAVISYISFPNTEFGIPGHYLFLVNGTSGLTQKISDLIVVNEQTAALSEIVELPFYLKIVLLSEPLHFGDYGGLFLKIVWALFTVGTFAVVCLGVASFFIKRRKSRMNISNAAPRAVVADPAKLKVKTSSYAVPIILALTTILGLIGALFASGVLAYVALGVVAVPLVVILFARRSDV